MGVGAAWERVQHGRECNIDEYSMVEIAIQMSTAWVSDKEAEASTLQLVECNTSTLQLVECYASTLQLVECYALIAVLPMQEDGCGWFI